MPFPSPNDCRSVEQQQQLQQLVMMKSVIVQLSAGRSIVYHSTSLKPSSYLLTCLVLIVSVPVVVAIPYNILDMLAFLLFF
jgi:hypothetical protein